MNGFARLFWLGYMLGYSIPSLRWEGKKSKNFLFMLKKLYFSWMNSYGAKQKSRLLIYMFIYINAKNYNKVIEKSRAQDLKEMLKKIFSLVIQSAFFMTRVFLVLFMFFFFFSVLAFNPSTACRHLRCWAFGGIFSSLSLWVRIKCFKLTKRTIKLDGRQQRISATLHFTRLQLSQSIEAAESSSLPSSS